MGSTHCAPANTFRVKALLAALLPTLSFSAFAGGRGNLVGSFDPRMVFLSVNANWKF